MNKATTITLAIVGIAIVGYLASFLVPLPSSWTGDSAAFHWTLANSVLYTLLYIGVAILFLVGIGAYKAALRAAYIKMAAGIVMVGAGLAQVVLLNIFGLTQTPWVQYGGVMLPFLVAGLAIYFGTRSMAKLVGVTSLLTKLGFTFPLLVGCMALVVFLPHGYASLPETFFDVANSISTWDVLLYGISLGLVLQIKNHSGTHYTQSMAWLAIGLLGSVAVTMSVLVGTFIVGKEPESYFIDAMVIIGGLLYLKAGHSFARTKEL